MNSPTVVLPLLIACGPSKPDDLAFLKKPFDELSTLRSDGIHFMNKKFKVKFRYIHRDQFLDDPPPLLSILYMGLTGSVLT